MIKLKKGLRIPIGGEPEQLVGERKEPRRVAILGGDYVGMKPTMAVRVSDPVRLGQALFTDKKRPAVKYTAPGAGRVVAIHRGAKRALLSVVIELSGDEEITFASYPDSELRGLDRSAVVEQLLESGLWTALRARPLSKVADPETEPHAIFVTAMDTNPLAPSIDRILERHEQSFVRGVTAIAKLTGGKLFICTAPQTFIPPILDVPPERVVVEAFAGPHPAGLVGTHIHFLDPVHRTKTVWHIGLQDVIAVGKLFSTGRLYVDRVVSVAGPAVKNPRLITTRIGASIDEIMAGELRDGENRVVSGSVLSGHAAREATAFLGRYHQQISVLPENRKRTLFGWISPGLRQHSVKNVVLSRFLGTRTFDFTTTTYGETRAIIPTGSFEEVMPLDILPLQLLRALAMDDVEEAENLGCLELDEEDLALCAYVCPSKLEFGPMLRRNLTLIEKEG